MYQVKCSICKRMIGFYGFGSHVAMHKKALGNDCYIKNRKKSNNTYQESKKIKEDKKQRTIDDYSHLTISVMLPKSKGI